MLRVKERLKLPTTDRAVLGSGERERVVAPARQV
jgi:hypothetical protein